jgi:hypothetical protein
MGVLEGVRANELTDKATVKYNNSSGGTDYDNVNGKRESEGSGNNKVEWSLF